LIEELDMVKTVAKQNQAFEAVYQSIEKDYPPNEKNSFVMNNMGRMESPDESRGDSDARGAKTNSVNDSNFRES
jgi:hypothetical protein